MNTYKITAKSSGLDGIEPFVDFFDASSESEAIAQWKAQAADCGIEENEIELVSVAFVRSV